MSNGTNRGLKMPKLPLRSRLKEGVSGRRQSIDIDIVGNEGRKDISRLADNAAKRQIVVDAGPATDDASCPAWLRVDRPGIPREADVSVEVVPIRPEDLPTPSEHSRKAANDWLSEFDQIGIAEDDP
jgi:hypothetical protein